MRGVDAALDALQPVALLDDLRDVPMRRRHLRPRELRQRRPPLLRAQVGPDHAAHLHRGIGRGADLVGEAAAPRARSSCPRTGRRRRTSSRGRRSAGRSPRCGRRRATPAGAGSAPRAGRSRPGVSRKATSSSPRSLTRTGGQSGSGSSRARSAGIQYRRIVVPIGVPGPTRVTRSLSSCASMIWPPVGRGIQPRAPRGYGLLSFMSSREGNGTSGIESSVCSARRGPTPRSVR